MCFFRLLFTLVPLNLMIAYAVSLLLSRKGMVSVGNLDERIYYPLFPLGTDQENIHVKNIRFLSRSFSFLP